MFQHVTTKKPTQEHTIQQSSTNPTSTADIRAAPRTHTKVTRANTPGILPILQQLPKPTSEGDRIAFSEGVNKQSDPMEATPDPYADHMKKRRRSLRLIPNDTPQGTETPPRTNRPIAIQTPRFITKEALNLFTYNFHANEQVRKRQAKHMFEVKANRNRNTAPYYATVIQPISGETITQYKKLAADPATQVVWTTAFGKNGEISHKEITRQEQSSRIPSSY